VALILLTLNSSVRVNWQNFAWPLMNLAGYYRETTK
jgi:hypothetical protein